jgi:glutaredoxin
MTKVFLNNIKQEYTEIDLDKNQAILERFKNEGFFATPIVEITGQEIFTGFHPEILTKLSNY